MPTPPPPPPPPPALDPAGYTEVELPLGGTCALRGPDGRVIAVLTFVGVRAWHGGHAIGRHKRRAQVGIEADRSVPIVRAELLGAGG